VILDGVPLSAAELWGRFRNYPRGHEETWSKFQQTGAVPRDMEYETSPRGRVVYDAAAERFILYADRCILRDKAVLRQIQRQLDLPAGISINLDEHYRCAKCLGLCGDSEW
jgi:hypothetical protein